MSIILDLFSLAAYLPFLAVDEEDIARNIKQLKKHQWFQECLSDSKYRRLIIHNQEVRQAIGKLKSNKIGKESYNEKCQKKIRNILQNAA
ncbi:hypothetical protein F9U64_02050 [Gracilibacillus oryzae]|uniref:Uncharacterized protein n=1 Tax=Gracilibacillus oryzae TaxID=1672701 RepID=A0A7C8KXZ1_9BACI|nr:hypothetical protein [Gracilibacillus oryzae]KAB8139193.1 hypothetical protein F9U64_02050 [Gracilibacillus oryzae]